MRDDRGLASEVLGKVPNKYMAVIVSAKRARALNDGARPQIKSSASKPTTLAMEEIAAGTVTPETEEQRLEAAKREAELLPPSEDTPETESESESEPIPESDTEIEDEDEEEGEDEDEVEPESEEE